MSGTSMNPYTIGHNCSVVILWQGTRYDFRDVTMFSSAQEVTPQRSDPLNSPPIEFNTPRGWRGTIGIDRATPTLDNLISSIEAAFWNAGVIGSGTIYQYIKEVDGSTTTFEFVNASLNLTAAGSYAAEAIVKQSLAFFSSLRNKL